MRRRLVVAMILVVLAAPVCLTAALAVGSVELGMAEILSALAGGGDRAAAQIVLELRLPRALAAFAVGGLLALSGALLQVLLRNPLADPYILGVSGGAAAAALSAIALGLASFAVDTAAFLGAMTAVLLVFGISRLGGHWSSHRLLLTGVVFAAGWGALISLILVLSPQAQIKGMLFWLLGDLSSAHHPGHALVVLTLGLIVAFVFARSLNVLVRGERVAAALGERPERLRAITYLLASLLTATAVTLAGTVGFIGLVVPHFLRLLGLSDHRWLLPASVFLGGALLTAADSLARTLTAPTQLPVGAVTALLGVPVFLYLLTREARRSVG